MKRQCGFVTRPDCRLHFEAMGEGPATRVRARARRLALFSWWQQMAHFGHAHTAASHSRIAASYRPRHRRKAPIRSSIAGDVAALADHLGAGYIR